MKIIPRSLLILFLLVIVGQETALHARSAKLENEMGVIFTPPPTYPYAAHTQRITGSGVYALESIIAATSSQFISPRVVEVGTWTVPR
jgi:hypothetical protein